MPFLPVQKLPSFPATKPALTRTAEEEISEKSMIAAEENEMIQNVFAFKESTC